MNAPEEAEWVWWQILASKATALLAKGSDGLTYVSLIKHACYPQDATMLTLHYIHSAIDAENSIQLQNTHAISVHDFMQCRHHTHTQSTRSTVTLTHRDSHSCTHFYILYSILTMHLKHCPCRLRPVEQSMALDSPLELLGGQWDLSWPPWCLLGVRSMVSTHRNIYTTRV